MADFSRLIIKRSGYEQPGFAGVYDRFRPPLAEPVMDIVLTMAQTRRPSLVVDLGSGTGLSARAWAARAERVVGVEPNPRMIEQARRSTAAGNVAYLRGFADQLALPDGCADVVTCAQAFHWMEPGPALAQAARILRPGGAFAAIDYDLPPVVHPEVDEAFEAQFAAERRARERLGVKLGAAYWPKDRHLEQIRASGLFRFAREIVCHGTGETDAAGVVGLAESVGGHREFPAGAAPEVHETFARLRGAADRVLGRATWPMILSYRIRCGVA